MARLDDTKEDEVVQFILIADRLLNTQNRRAHMDMSFSCFSSAHAMMVNLSRNSRRVRTCNSRCIAEQCMTFETLHVRGNCPVHLEDPDRALTILGWGKLGARVRDLRVSKILRDHG